jgi:hypothetical protein
MKFSQNLHQYQILEWAPFYIDYQRLKRLYKTATGQAVERGGKPDFTGLLFGIISCLELTAVQNSQLSWSTTWPRPNPSTSSVMHLSSEE